MRKVTILMAALLLAPVGLQAETLEDLLVEKGVITKGATDTTPRASMQAAKVYYKDGTVIEAPDAGFSLKLNVQLQERYTYQDPEFGGSSSQFTTRRARLQASGTALNKEFSYKLQADFVGQDEAEDGDRDPDLRDAYIVWHACDSMWAKMGQFKGSVSRQNGTSSAKLTFADRSIASDVFSGDRVQGLALGGDVEGFGWEVQFHNGANQSRNSPDFSSSGIVGGADTNHGANAAIRYDLMGEMDAHEEGDVGDSDGNNLNMGLAFAYSDDEFAEGEFTTYIVNPDLSYKGSGLSAHAEYYYQSLDPDEGSGSIDNQGFYAQVGYFIDPSKWEVALRYSQVDPDDADLTNTDFEEYTGAVNYYWWAHALKAGVNYTHRTADFGTGGEDSEEDTNLWIFQVSSWF